LSDCGVYRHNFSDSASCTPLPIFFQWRQARIASPAPAVLRARSLSPIQTAFPSIAGPKRKSETFRLENQLKVPQPQLHAIGRGPRQPALGGEKLDLLQSTAIFVENSIARIHCALAVVDLPKSSTVLLHDALSSATPVLNNRPVSVLLAVLPPLCAS
jgi:hypothetical protein